MLSTRYTQKSPAAKLPPAPEDPFCTCHAGLSYICSLSYLHDEPEGLIGATLPTVGPGAQELVVKRASRVHKRFPFPISEPLVDPLLPLPRGRI